MPKQIRRIKDCGHSPKYAKGRCRKCYSNAKYLPGDARKENLKYFHNTTPEEFDRQLAKQGGGCAICGRRDVGFTRKKAPVRYLHQDHNHKTNKNRGILCGPCNRGLGYFLDSLELLQKAIDYLKEWDVNG
jgi:hypothetical protein